MDPRYRFSYDETGRAVPHKDAPINPPPPPHSLFSPPVTQPSSLSSSLLNNLDSITRLRSFFNFDDVPFPGYVTDFPRPDITAAKTRLEVLTSWEITFTTLSLYIVAALSLAYTFYLTHSLHSSDAVPPPSDFRKLFALVLNAVSFIIAALYSLRLTLGPEPLEHEQLSTAILLATGFLFRNPLTTDLEHINPTTQLTIDSVYTFACYFYLFSAAHSYRVQQDTTLPFDFYLPKISFLSLYILSKILLTTIFDISLPLIPFSPLIPYILLVTSSRITYTLTIPILTIIFLDSLMLLSLTKQITTTALTLTKIPYLKHRAKQLGFRCFVYQSLVFTNAFLLVSFFVNIMTPRHILYNAYDKSIASNNRSYFLRFESEVGGLPLAFIFTMWTVILAYVNLPPGPIWPWHFGGENIRGARMRVTNFVRRYTGGGVGVNGGGGDGDEGGSGSEDGSVGGEERELGDRRGDGNLGGSLFGIWSTGGTVFPYRYSHREWSSVDLVDGEKGGVWKSGIGGGGDERSARFEGGQGHDRDHRHEVMLSPQSSHGDNELWNAQFIARQRREGSPLFSPREMPITSLVDNGQFQLGPSYGAMLGRDQSNPQLRRLSMKKNLLVMETQAILMNASYLSYLPGNREEEAFSRAGKYPSTAAALYNERGGDSVEEKEEIEKGHDPLLFPGKDELEWSDDTDGGLDEDFFAEKEDYIHPVRDDGTFFRVDVERLVNERGYEITAHIVDDEINAHAIVLSGKDRVIVAFSGTRDARNWASNMQLRRETWSDMFGDSPFRRPPMKDETQQSANVSGSSKRENVARTTGAVGEARGRQPATQSPSANVGHPVNPQLNHVGAVIAKELTTLGQPKIHRGFGEAYKRLRFPVFDTLKSLFTNPRKPVEHGPNDEVYESGLYNLKQEKRLRGGGGEAVGKRLFFCGHSLGGAIASFACYDACRHWKELGVLGRDDIACTTFGCPKVGNVAFQARYNATVLMHWRFEIAGDPIVGMPKLLNYVHVGTQALLDRSGELLIDPSFVERAWWASLAGVLGGYRLHFRASYMEAVKKYARKYENGSDPLNDVFWPLPTSVQTGNLFSD